LQLRQQLASPFFFGQQSRLPVDEGRVSEPPLKRPVEAGRVFVADGAGDFLDAQIGVLQQVGGLLQPPLTKNVAKASARLLLKQVLQARSAQVELEREGVDGATR
jgi:hypothetical protein